MKLSFLALLAACTVLCFLAACQKEQAVDDTAAPTTATSSAEEAPASSTTSPVSADQEFVTAAGQAGGTEVKAGQLAETKSSDADVKKFGALMVTQHTELGDELKTIAASNGFTFPADIGPENQAMLDELAAKSGSEFDQPYSQDMVQGHQQAVQLFENASKNAQNPDLKAWATRSLPIIQMHLEMAEKLP